TETEDQDEPLTLLERAQSRVDLAHGVALERGLGWVDLARVSDEVAHRGIAVLADRTVEADEFLHGVADLADAGRGEADLLRDLLLRGVTALLLTQAKLGRAELAVQLPHVGRDTDRAALAGDTALQGLPDPPHGVRRELVAL